MKQFLLRRKGAQRLASATAPAVLRLWRDWIRPHWRVLLAVLACLLLVAGATALYPVIIKFAFDGFGSRAENVILTAPLLVIAITTVRGMSLYGQSVLTNRVVTRIEADMQTALYGSLVDADLAQTAFESPAAFTQRFTTDFVYIKEALTRLSTVLLRDAATVVGLAATMVWIDPALTLIAGVVAPFAATPIARIGKKLRRMSTSTQERAGEMASLISESLSGARVAKTFSLEGYLKQRAAQAFEEMRDIKMKAANARARLDPLLEIGGGLAVAGVLAIISLRIAGGKTTIGDFTGFVSALLLAAQPIRSIGTLNAILQEAAAALVRTFAVMDQRPTLIDAPGAQALVVSKGEVVFRSVCFRYNADASALDGVHLTAKGGETTALVGRSGSGKSTLLSLVPRLYDVEGGAVLIDGQDVRDVTLASLRAAVSVVSQDVVLFDDTVRANIAFGRPGAEDEEIIAAAQAAAAHDFIMRLPDAYNTRVGVAGARFSGGERQRISLARAILKDAPILLLDEATSALDAEAEHAVQGALALLMQGRTTLVIAHRLSTVREASQIAVMDAGRIVESESHQELLSRGGIYATLQTLQMS